MKHIKKYKAFESLDQEVDNGQFFLPLEDEGFFIEVFDGDKGRTSGIQSNIKIYKPKGEYKKTQYFKDLQVFSIDEVRDEVLRLIEMGRDVKYIYADVLIDERDHMNKTVILYDPKQMTRFKSDGSNKLLSDDFNLDILQITIVYGL